MAGSSTGVATPISAPVPDAGTVGARDRSAVAPVAMTGTVLALVTATALLVSFSESMLIPALPTIQAEYDASAAAVSWVPAIYLLVGAISVPLFGKLGDMYGKKRMLILVMTAYSLAVVLDGFSWNLESLLVFRAVQGLGLAMFPLVLSMIHDQMSESRVAVSVGVVSAMNGVGAAIGLIIGAYITQVYGWQTNYHILAPFAIGLTAALWLLARESPRHAGETIDIAGIAVLGAMVTFLLVAISEGGTFGWTSVTTISLVLLSVVFGIALLLVERRGKDPLIAVRSPSIGTLMKVNLAMLLAGGVMFIGFYGVIYFAQEPGVGLGRDVSEAALILAPAALLMLLFAPLGGRLAQRQGPKPVELVGFALVVIAFVLLLLFHTTAVQIAIGAVVLLAGVSLLLTALSISIMIVAPSEKVGTEMGLNTAFRTIGQAVGVAIAGSFLASLVLASGLPSDLAYRDIAVAGIIMGAIGLLIVLTLPKLVAKGPMAPPVG